MFFFGLAVVVAIALSCTGLWHWLGTEKDSIDSAIKIIGVIGVAFAILQFFRDRSAEHRRRALEMEREVFMELVGKIAAQSEEFAKYLVPAQTEIKTVDGLNGAIIKMQIIASQDTVATVMDLVTAYAATLPKMVELKKPAWLADNLRKRFEKQLDELFEKRATVPAQTQSPMPGGNTSASSNDEPRVDLTIINARVEELQRVWRVAKIEGAEKWKYFFSEYVETLDGLTAKTRNVVIALRRELGVSSDTEKLLEILTAANAAGRKYAETVLGELHRIHTA